MKKIKKYLCAGTIIHNNKKSIKFIEIDEENKKLLEDKIMSFSGKLKCWLGVIVEIKHTKDNEYSGFKHVDIDFKIDKIFLEKLRVESVAHEEQYKEILSIKKIKQDVKNLDDLTLGQIKEYSKNNYQIKKMIKRYILMEL